MELTNGTAATPLNYAVLERYKKLALLLIEFGANVNGRLSIESDDEVRSTSPLHFAIHQPEIFKALIARGAPIDALDGNSQTPLFWAVESKSVEAVEIVLKAGADPTWKQPSAGWTLFKMLETNEEDSKEDIESKRKIAEMLRQAIAAREKETKQPH